MSAGEAINPVARLPEPDDGFLIQTRADCLHCWGCVRVCPSRALKIVDGSTRVSAERCVKCGACVTHCAHSGHVVRDDTAAVNELLRSGRTVVALLATEAVAALYPSSLDDVENALEALGFAAVETAVLGEEMVAEAYERLHADEDDGALPKLRSTCPVTVEWVKRYYPQLTAMLVPLVPPYVAQARLIRRLYPGDVSVVYVSPCFARKDDVADPEIAGDVDVVIDFAELREMIASASPRPGRHVSPSRRTRPSKQLSVTDGFPRRLLAGDTTSGERIAVVRGLRELDALLSAMVAGEAAPDVVDMLLCEGCVDGPTVAPALSLYAKRSIAAVGHAHDGHALVDSRRLLAAMPPVDLYRSFTPQPTLRSVPSAAAVDACLLEGGFRSRADAPDCGACGWDTCVEHAEAILDERSNWDMCFVRQGKRLESASAELDRCSTVDGLTGLHNRHVFEARLTEEVLRAGRSGSALSLVLLDIDEISAVIELFGLASADAVVAGVGRVLARELRRSDVVCRVGDDEFALLLPDTPKTHAFAAAEKLREAMQAHPVATVEDASIFVTASFGVASLGETVDSEASLLAAARTALTSAKDAGRDRTQLSAG